MLGLLRMGRVLCFVVIGFVAVPAGSALADTLDQSQTDGSGSPIQITASRHVSSGAQTFTAGLTGGLDRVDLDLAGDASTPVEVEITSASGGKPGGTVLASTSLASSSVPEKPLFVEVDFASPAQVTAGTQYAIVAFTADTSGEDRWYTSPGDPYSSGAEWQDAASPPDGSWFGGQSDFAFKTYVQVPDTPADLSIGTAPDIVTEATSASGRVVSYQVPSATDDAISPTVTCLPASGSTFAVGATTVKCVASDSDDTPSSVQSTFKVTVTDSDLALKNVPADITTPATSDNGAAVTYTPPTASDEGGQSPPASCIPASGSTFAVGTTTVTCSASAADGDDSNSPVSATFKVTVTQASTSLTAAPQLVVFPPSRAVGLGRVSAILTGGGRRVVGEPITFSVGATKLCTAVTSTNGTATCRLNVFQELEVLIANRYQARFAGNSAFAPSRASTRALELRET
ncbi:MAG: HYR domain-containing protein [Dehalococcoidia bacterium]